MVQAIAGVEDFCRIIMMTRALLTHFPVATVLNALLEHINFEEFVQSGKSLCCLQGGSHTGQSVIFDVMTTLALCLSTVALLAGRTAKGQQNINRWHNVQQVPHTAHMQWHAALVFIWWCYRMQSCQLLSSIPSCKCIGSLRQLHGCCSFVLHFGMHVGGSCDSSAKADSAMHLMQVIGAAEHAALQPAVRGLDYLDTDDPNKVLSCLSYALCSESWSCMDLRYINAGTVTSLHEELCKTAQAM